MINPRERNVIRQRVHSRIRAKMSGTAERPRLNVYRSLNHIYTQLIDDLNGVTIASASSFGKKGVEKAYGGNVAAAAEVGKAIAERENDKQAAFHGLARALVFNAVTGVTTGWTKDLDIVGIGYRAELKGKKMVVFTLGYSHPIEFPLPTGIEVAIDPKQTHLTISGIDRQKVGQIAADMRSLRKPDPYKNKGVRYTGEKLKKKAGKSGSK